MKIRELRERKGMTQAELAKAVNVSKATACQWESGLRRPSLVNLLALANVLECTIDDIVGRDWPQQAVDVS